MKDIFLAIKQRSYKVSKGRNWNEILRAEIELEIIVMNRYIKK